METTDTIHGFWFGSNKDDAAVAAECASLWWSKSPDTDAEIKERFERWVRDAAGGALEDWASTPTGRLSLILLTDQFPRNIYRDTPGAFELDSLSRAWCVGGLSNGADRLLRPIERVFFYLPLEHSESLRDQDRCVELFRELAREVAPGWRATFDGFLDFAVQHRAIIERFGRFPHRNSVLGRASAPEELAFLEQPGSSF